MARTPRWMQAGVRSYRDATRRTFNPGSQPSQEAFVARIWPELRPVCTWLDSLRDESVRPAAGNRVHYARSAMMIFFVVALALNLSIAEAYTCVQASRRLRKLAGFSEPSEKTLEMLAQSKFADDVREPGFPRRQTVVTFFDWLERWAGQEVVDQSTGEITQMVCIEPLERIAYAVLPVRMAKQFRLNLSRVAIDSKRIKSPRRRNSGNRPDQGAEYIGRAGEKAMLGRLKVSAVATEVPVIVASSITTDGELTHVREQLIDHLADNSEEMKAIAEELGMPSFQALDQALLVGDFGFHEPATMRKIHERKFFGAFRLQHSLTRKVIGTREVNRRDGGSMILEVCNDGVHFCVCDAKKHPHERRPMFQTAGALGDNPHVKVECTNPTCAAFGVRWYVPLRNPDKVFANDRRELGDINHALVNPVSRAFKDVEVAIFKGCQAIEHYHSQLLVKLGLGITDTKGRRKFSGDLRHRFYYALGDLIWNLIIYFNLQDGFAHTHIERDDLWKSTERAARKVMARRNMTHAELLDAAGDSVAGTDPKNKQKKKPKKPPTFAQYAWRHQTS